MIGPVRNQTLVTTENHPVGYFVNVTNPEGRRSQIVTQFLIGN
ncbi:hypothetical protein [Laspinema palackyanum]